MSVRLSALAVFRSRGTFAQGDLSNLFLITWKNLEETLEYAVPNAAAPNQWAAETFSVVEDRGDDQNIPDLKLNLYSTLTYLATTGEILFDMAH